jgi:hypothetical protein
VLLIRWALCVAALLYVLQSSSPRQITDLLNMQPIRNRLLDIERRIR